MDRHHVPDRAALRHRPRHAAHQGRAAGRRQLQAHRPEDLHLGRRTRPGAPTSSTWCWPACPTHRPAARASRCSWCRSSWSRPTARWASATPSLAARSSTRWASTATPPARSTSTAPWARWWASRNKGLAAMFVMMNAARLGVGNQCLGLTEVAYQNAVAYAKDRIQMRSLSGPKAPDKPADPIIVHPDVRKMLLTARAYAEGGRALAIYIALLIDKELQQRRRRRAQGLRRPGGAADAHRQGLPHRQRLDRHLALHAGLRRPRLHQERGHGAVRARRPHQHDLRGHQHHPVARPAGPQGAGRQRRQAEEVRPADRRSSSKTKAPTKRCRSSSTRWPTWATRSPS